MIWFIIFLLFIYLIANSQIFQGKENAVNTQTFLVGLSILLLMGFRDKTFAGDTVMYVYKFQESIIEWVGWRGFFFEQREPLFYFFEFLLQKCTLNYTIFLILNALPVCIGFSLLIKRYSADLFISTLLFCGLGILYFCMAGLRQSMAMGFTMISYLYARERKLVPFLLWVLVAYLFHNSAIVFLPVYWIITVNSPILLWIAILSCFLLGIFRPEAVMNFANMFTSKQYQMDEHGLKLTMFFIQLAFLVFCCIYQYLFVKEKNNKMNKWINPILVLCFTGTCFQAMTPIKGEFFRVSLYFCTFLCLAVPDSIAKIHNPDKKRLCKLGIIVVLLAYIFRLGIARSYITCF